MIFSVEYTERVIRPAIVINRAGIERYESYLYEPKKLNIITGIVINSMNSLSP